MINESPIQTFASLELFILKKLLKNNKKTFILSCGVDYLNVQYCLKNKDFKSIFVPLFKDSSLQSYYQYCFDYLEPSHIKTHDFLYNNCNGIIATDFDYTNALTNNAKYLGLIPNPVNISNFSFQEIETKDTIVLFLGINNWNYYPKGINYFEELLKIINTKYADRIEIIVAKNLPYKEYITSYNKAHIIFDQIFANDQGYNALEAMAKGKVVFTGAEDDFVHFYNLKEPVCINAKPDIKYLVEKLSYLIENPQEIIAIGKRARDFVEKEHDYIRIAEKYLEVWNAGNLIQR